MPVKPFARALVMIEQLAGIAYVAMVVSRLVGLLVLRGADRRWTRGAVLATGSHCAPRAPPVTGSLGGVADETLAFVLALAGGAVLAALADTLMPEAFEHGAPWNALATAVGFFLAFVLAGA